MKFVLLYLFSETTGPVGTKLRRNAHCTVLLQDWGFMGNMHTQKQEAHELLHRMGNIPLFIHQEY